MRLNHWVFVKGGERFRVQVVHLTQVWITANNEGKMLKIHQSTGNADRPVRK
eukprot:m.616066 g.616066  ORF g.616066 m.616066 type:complete len:52 (-) comp22511_c0_seq13:1267-1422(-)